MTIVTACKACPKRSRDIMHLYGTWSMTSSEYYHQRKVNGRSNSADQPLQGGVIAYNDPCISSDSCRFDSDDRGAEWGPECMAGPTTIYILPLPRDLSSFKEHPVHFPPYGVFKFLMVMIFTTYYFIFGFTFKDTMNQMIMGQLSLRRWDEAKKG